MTKFTEHGGPHPQGDSFTTPARFQLPISSSHLQASLHPNPK